MKLALFFVLSFVVHATAFLVPISLNRRAAERAIAVTVLPPSAAGDSSEGRPGSQPGHGGRLQRKAISADAISNSTQEKDAMAPAVSESLTASSPVTVDAKASDTNVALASAHLPVETTTPGGRSDGAGNGSNGASVGAATPMGLGIGNGEAPRTPISLRYAPMPRYPERARQRGGKEGKVLLRVVVDVAGHTKAVDIMASSGDETLDQTARDTVKTWRFTPARYGNHPVEGWVDVPIVFRLNDANY